MSKHEAVTFEANRVEIGMTVGDRELGRRLSQELQLPQSYGLRLLKAYKYVLQDALLHGEGINLYVGVLKMKEFATREYSQGFFTGQPRRKMYKYIWSTTEVGDDNIIKLTKENFNGV